MATTKKNSPKSKSAKSAKKISSPAKKASAKKSTPNQQAVRSFRVSKPETPFLTFSLTRQTAYWLVLGLIVVIFAIWLNKLQADIQSIYDTIDASSATENIPLPAKKQ